LFSDARPMDRVRLELLCTRHCALRGPQLRSHLRKPRGHGEIVSAQDPASAKQGRWDSRVSDKTWIVIFVLSVIGVTLLVVYLLMTTPRVYTQ